MATNPLSPLENPQDTDSAAAIIREKLDRIYGKEPDANQELSEAESVSHRSKHQQFMHNLSKSGKDLAAIQTEWHQYYQSLPPQEQHQVWQEFYSSQSLLNKQPVVASPHAVAEHKHQAASSARTKPAGAKSSKILKARGSKEIQNAIRDKVTANGKLKAKHHLQSLFFGLAMGFVVVLIFLFGFFNEVVLAPFIQPSRVSASTPIIVSDSTVAASDKTEIVVPKINLQIPVDYSQTTTSEAAIEDALDNGIVHYPTTVKPGELGNAAFFGHSSNNIFNKGKYKFAFVLLRTLVPGDTFYLTYESKVYVYKVISKTVVPPTQVSVLGPVEGQSATATLITCDPPGTSLNRLVIVGEQITPNPTANTASTVVPPTTDVTSAGEALPGNGPTLWGRFISTFAGKATVGILLAAITVFVVRQATKTRRR